MITNIAIVFLGLLFVGILFGVGAMIYKATQSISPPMACPETDYQEKCDISPEEATVDQWSAASWGKYEMTVTCNRCGEKFHRFGLKKHELRDARIDVDKRL